MKKVIESGLRGLLLIAIGLLGISFCMSMVRAGGKPGDKESPNCKKMQIDRLEPLISTRWFCEIIKGEP